MPEFDLIGSLTECFKGIPDGMVRQLEYVAENIPLEDRERVFQDMLDHVEANHRPGVKDLKDSLRRLGIPWTSGPALSVVTRDWQCDACGVSFKYHPAPTEDMQIDARIYNRCPNCGLFVQDTILAEAYAAMGRAVPWYLVEKAKRLTEDDETGKNSGYGYGLAKKRGPWFNRKARERERREAVTEAFNVDELLGRVQFPPRGTPPKSPQGPVLTR